MGFLQNNWLFQLMACEEDLAFTLVAIISLLCFDHSFVVSWERSYTEMKKTIAILRALVEVMESLSKDADPYGVGRQITEEVHIIYIRLIFTSKIPFVSF